MTDSQEPSYYEIALTNRQVVVAFVILLTCLMGTFFAGVWVGRGEAAGTATARTAEQGPAETEDLQELDFFGGGPGEEEPAGGAGAGEAAPREDPPREDPVVQRNRRQAAERGQDLTGGEGPALSEEAPARPAAETPTAETPAARPEAPPPTAPPTTSRPRTPEGDTPPPRPRPRDEGAAAETPLEGPVVQVFSSANRQQAEAVVQRLTDGGQPAYLSPVDVDGQTMYRVRIGPFRDRAQAERVAEQVKRTYRLDTWITQ